MSINPNCTECKGSGWVYEQGLDVDGKAAANFPCKLCFPCSYDVHKSMEIIKSNNKLLRAIERDHRNQLASFGFVVYETGWK